MNFLKKNLILFIITASFIPFVLPAHASILPNDTYYTNQWYLKRIRATEAWDINHSASTIIVAIIDSGVQIHHPDLEANLWVNPGEIPGNNKDDDHNGLIDDVYGWDFVNNVADPSPKFKSGFTEAGIIHGTLVAGIAASVGNNNEGTSGISWDSKIMSLKALDDKGSGNIATVIKAIDYAINKGANIINLSFVGYGHSLAFEDALRRARAAGVLVVAPAGNEQPTTQGLNLNSRPLYPACYRDTDGQKLAIGVAATDALDQKTDFSGYGNRCIEIAAPGVSFFTTSVYAPTESNAGQFFNQYYDGYWSGTSMAVPVVSGTLALIEGTNPNLSPDQALSILLSSADDINQLNPDYVNQLGKGRVNVAQAILKAALTLKNRTARFAFAPASGRAPYITISDSAGFKEKEFLAYPETFTGGLNLAAGDLNGDGNEEIIAAPASGREADIKIFKSDGTLVTHFLAYPYDFKGGVNVVVADVDGDGHSEIITSPVSGLEPLVKIFDKNGKFIRSFLAYPASFKGGVSVAVGNVRSEVGNEIVTVPGRGGIPQVKIFSHDGKLLNYFLAGSQTDIQGLRVAVGDLDGNPRRREAELILSSQSGLPFVKLYDFRGNLRNKWNPYSNSFSGDVRLISADLNRDGFTDIITMPGPSGGPHVRIFNRQGELSKSFYAYQSDFNEGLSGTVFLTHN